MAGTDLVSLAIADLYSGDLETFIERRRELATQARASGDRAAATAIAGLGKPTRSAWIVNRLTRTDPSVAASLTELGDRLRAGEAALDGATIRELSRARRDLIDTLVRRAFAETGEQAPSATLRDEVTGTISAALADPAVTEQVTAGTLVRAAHWAGFGPGIGATAEAAGAARERRAAIAAAEQALAEATRTAESAAAAELEVAESVRFMEQRLRQEQQRLADARRQAREAEAALSRARLALGRLPRSP